MKRNVTWHLRMIGPLFGAALALAIGLAPAQANRFGYPWMGQVTADQTTMYASPDRSNPIGPIGRGAMLAVSGGQDEMYQTPDGWVAASDVTEATQPWIAEVDATASLYAKPNAGEGIIRTANSGDLVRVMGVSPGVDGDGNLWWATTDGYAGLHAIKGTSNPDAQNWTLPAGDDALNGWWGVAKPANVRAAPRTDAPVVGEFSGGEHVKVLAEEQGDDVNGNSTWYRIDGGRFAGAHVHSSLIERQPDPKPTVVPPDREVGHDAWIVVDRSSSTLSLLRDGEPVFTTYVSLGKAGVETNDGTYATYIKYRADRMTSTSVPNADHSYDLPNVPFTQYFKSDGSALHATYWHDAFGTTQSQGCVNVTWTDGEYLFGQTKPQIPPDQIGFVVDPEQATPVVVVE